MSELFRAEALAARRELAGPGRLLGGPRLAALWLALAVMLVGGVVAAAAIQVPVYSVHAVGRHHVVVRSGSEPLIRLLWQGVA
ncbi:MAG TPA: hypothetical protein VF137_10530 [Candidatus Dormibacteraeota bacterium]